MTIDAAPSTGGLTPSDRPHVPAAPPVAGLVFRHAVGARDADALRAVHLARAARDEIDALSTMEGVPTREQMVAGLSSAAAAERLDRWVVAQVAGTVVGYGRVGAWREQDGTWVYLCLGWVVPEWRGRGIGTAVLDWGEHLARHLSAAEHPGDRAELAGNASSTEREATALLLEAGYRAAYVALEMGLARETPIASALPRGIAVRPVAPAHLPAIADCVCDAYRDEYEGGRYNEGAEPATYAAELAEPRQDPTLWQVAWDGDRVVGQVLSIVANGRAEVFEVSVCAAWRRRGLARALLTRALVDLRGRGVETIRLHTRADFRTRARDLYESVGFRVLKEFPRYRKPMPIGAAGGPEPVRIR